MDPLDEDYLLALVPYLLIGVMLAGSAGVLFYRGFGTVGIEIFGIVVSGLLTLTLIFIYGRQNEILSQQSNILKAEHRPVVSVVDRDIGVESPSAFDGGVSTNYVTLKLQNSGNEVAMNLRLLCHIEYDGESTLAVGPNENTLNQPETSSGTIETKGGVLPARDSVQDFYTQVTFENLEYTADGEHGHERTPFAVALAKFQDGNVSEVRIGFWLRFENTIGEEFTVGVNPGYKLTQSRLNEMSGLADLDSGRDSDFLETIFSEAVIEEIEGDGDNR